MWKHFKQIEKIANIVLTLIRDAGAYWYRAHSSSGVFIIRGQTRSKINVLGLWSLVRVPYPSSQVSWFYGPKCGLLIWAPNLGSKFGPQMWAQVWSPDLGSNFAGQIGASDLGPRFGAQSGSRRSTFWRVWAAERPKLQGV